MSKETLDDNGGEKKSRKRSEGSVQPLDGDLAKWIARQYRGGEAPHAIDCYPLHRGRDREQRLYHYDLKGDESVDVERAAVLANEIFSDCQLHCDKLPSNALSRDGSKTYQVAIIDERRGGLAAPVGTFLLKLMPRIHGAAPTENDDIDELNAEDGEALTGRKMMMETFKEVLGRDERSQQGINAVVGEVMLLQKEHIKDSFEMIRELHRDNRATMTELRELIKQESQRRVEEKAVAIDAENAAVDREFRRAQMSKENMMTDVTRAGLLEAIKVVGQLFPGFGQLAIASISGKPLPPPPQLTPNGTANGATNGTNGVAGQTQPQLPPADNEKVYVDRFIEAAEKHKVGDSTAAEKLFGKDDDAGKPIEAGVFTREQVAILTGVHMGSLGVEALDALLPGSAKPEEVQGLQMVKAVAYLTPEMLSDMSRFLELRKAAKKS